MDEEQEIQLGPAMAALTEKQRGFVFAMLSDPLATPSEWARAAGYDPNGSDRVAGHHLSRSPKIEAAANELARAHLNTFGPALGIGVMMMVARNPEHKDQLKAAAMLANRTGFHETTEHVVVSKTDRTPKAIDQRIARALEKLEKLGLVPKLAPPIDAEFKVIDAK